MRSLLIVLLATSLAYPADPKFASEFIFPLEDWHNHGSCIVECPNGDLLVCWFHGSGERTADDVEIRGARKRPTDHQWSQPFLMADTPSFPDTNCCMLVDRQDRLWLLWPTIQANTWESALMKFKISTTYSAAGPPIWQTEKVLHIKPGDKFPEQVQRKANAYLDTTETPGLSHDDRLKWKSHLMQQASDKLTRRIGWFTRAHPFIRSDGTILVGLYSDGFSFSLVAMTKDVGHTWQFSEPIVGGGNIQPSFANKKSGAIVAYMRDNGPPPMRVLQSESHDGGITWDPVTDHAQLPNPGAGLELANLKNGDWICVYNDLEDGRHSLAVSISKDEGKTWPHTRHLEQQPQGLGRFHYPSIIQARDGNIHVTYSYFSPTAEGERKSIKYATFNREWILQSESD